MRGNLHRMFFKLHEHLYHEWHTMKLHFRASVSMELSYCLFILACVASSAQISAQSTPSSQATLRYIHASWDLLTRTEADCRALSDTKVAGISVLYLPQEIAMPAEVEAIEQKCHAKVMRLPRPIQKLGDVQPEELPAQGLLYLPHPYVVPGERFNEMYGWDSYFILLGLEVDHHEALAKDIVDNFLFEVEHYGSVLNANRTYYLTRSQPPFLPSMIRLVYENPASFPATPAGRAQARTWLKHAYRAAQKDYSTWTRPEHLAGKTGLARYFDYGTGPVPEMADADTYYPDVIRSLVKNPTQYNARFLVKATAHPNSAEAEQLKRTSCDVQSSPVCARAWFGGYRLSREFFMGDRAMRESGFDTSNRFGPFSGATHEYAPVCLNSLLYRYERDMKDFARLLALPQDVHRWNRRAQARSASVQRYLWRPRQGVFADYDFVHARSSDYASVTSLYPLWSGLATPAQAYSMKSKLDLFERHGGLSTSNVHTGLQWDEPYGWAPMNWIAASGLEATGFHVDAVRIASHFNATVDAVFAADGTIREKYNVVAGNAQVDLRAGYAQNAIGFGWTNAVYLKLQQIAFGMPFRFIAPPM
jgi:alpha,alpha-trehalase